MGKLKLIIAGLVVGGVASVLGLQYSAGNKLREENAALKLELTELKQAHEAREPVSQEDSSSKERLAELLRLRGEATHLRQQTNQIAGLKEANQKLLSAVKELESTRTNSAPKKGPRDVLPQDIHPKATWAYRGYGTPDATFESVLSAMFNGDKAAFLAGLSPEMRAKADEQFESIVERAKVDDDKPAEFRILDRRALSEDEMVLTIYGISQNPHDGRAPGSSENIVFQRINGEWQITEKHPPGN